jgi:hypothetical protein
VILVACLYHQLLFAQQPSGDFRNHLEWGRRFVANEFLYQDGLNVPYPPAWALPFALLSLLPATLAFTLFSLGGLAALAVILQVGNRLARGWLPLTGRKLLGLYLVALVVCRPYILRDLQDGGPNLQLTALTWGGIYLCWRDQNGRGGACLGVAAALKCTALLFVAYLAWKRQWRAVTVAVLVLAAMTVAPALRQGPALFVRHMTAWVSQVGPGVSRADPRCGVLGLEEVKNKALRPVLARFLLSAPADSREICNAWPAYHLELSTSTAGHLIQVVSLLLIGFVAWFLRPTQAVGTIAFVECASVGLLMLFLSPITWLQHCVGAVPAFYLLLRSAFAGCTSRALNGCLATLAFINVVVLNRSLFRGPLAAAVEAYGTVTVSLLVVLALCLVSRRRLVPKRPVNHEVSSSALRTV